MTSQHQPDRRSPLVIDVLELGRRAGTMRTFQQDVPAPDRLAIGMIGVPEGSPVHLDLRLESVVDGVLVTGTAAVQLRGDCSRCLRSLEDETSYPVQELYFHPGKEDSEDDHVIVDDLLDLEGALRDSVVLNLPFSPLCRPDCLGLCPQCGADLNDDPSHRHEEQADPRWDKLKELTIESDN